ncbi:hypothetical protein L1987_08292 [Smallanthus sonchifolius]|uniref:Uncharacterized protein n=1 Tax=Smallanthus sonchifolius TaxID=185202 RepID=A0ACB9JKN3_9ASTR|nr:hypothetical protein L1987_08292 [Smallanthus sonchifolius]
MRADKVNKILEELRDVIVGGKNVQKNHEGSYCGVIRHSRKGGVRSTSHRYGHLVNMKKLIHYNDFSFYANYVHVDDNSKVTLGPEIPPPVSSTSLQSAGQLPIDRNLRFLTGKRFFYPVPVC